MARAFIIGIGIERDAVGTSRHQLVMLTNFPLRNGTFRIRELVTI
jgi:hypothetical protein